MNNGLCRRVLFAPYCRGHGTDLSIDIHNTELVSTRPLHWNYVESENVTSLMGTFDMHCDELVRVMGLGVMLLT